MFYNFLPKVCSAAYASSSSSSSNISTTSTTNEHTPLSQSPTLSSAGHRVRITEKIPQRLATEDLLMKIKSFLVHDYYYGSVDLALYVNEDGYRAFRQELDSPCILDGKQADSIRYTWDPTKEQLIIPCMPYPVHDAIQLLVVNMRDGMVDDRFLSRSERSLVYHFSGTDISLTPDIGPIGRNNIAKGKQAAGVVKQPDAAFTYVDITSGIMSGTPRVIFEVGFSQSYESLLEDACRWLVRTDGMVELCVIVKIAEGPHRRKVIDENEIRGKMMEQHRVREEYNENADEAQSCDGLMTTESVNSSSSDSMLGTPGGFSRFFQAAGEHSAWVGELSGFIELYRLDANKTSIIRDGPRYDLFDEAGPSPVIKISDLLPPEKIEGNPKRGYEIPLGVYRSLLKQATQEMALIGKQLATQNANFTDSDYESDGESPDSDE